MARLIITSNTHERESTFWEGHDLNEVLPKLGEVVQTLGRLYEAIEARGIDPTTVTIAVGGGGGWCCHGAGYESYDVVLEINADREALVQLVSCPEFRGEFLGGLSLEEALALVRPDPATRS